MLISPFDSYGFRALNFKLQAGQFKFYLFENPLEGLSCDGVQIL